MYHSIDKLNINKNVEVIPMMNPDGVYLGNYRGSLIGKTFCLTQLLQNLSP
jgi:hypothetical protein